MLYNSYANSGPKQFKFFNAWLQDIECEKIVKIAWDKEVKSKKPDCIFLDKLRNVKEDLKKWSAVNFGKLDYEIKELKSSIDDLETQAEDGLLDEEGRNIWKTKRRQWMEKEKFKKDMLSQKAKLKWWVEGDENTKFFHSAVKRREWRNNMSGVMINDSWIEDPEQIKREATKYFQSFYKKPGDTIGNNMVRFKSEKFKKLTIMEKQELEKEFSEIEVWAAIKNCGTSKSPGPDGFTFGFYKHFWHLIKRDLLKAIAWFWKEATISNGCNSLFITLIQKADDPMTFGDYRPINLIGSYYKIITKTLSIRLKNVISKLIGGEQSAFIQGRSILDSILIAGETWKDLEKRETKI